jgi:hypothetical protein
MDKTELDDPRAVDILTTEHWSLLSTRTLGYQEMFGRTTIFVATLSGIVVTLALLAQATRFSRHTLSLALPLISVALLIGIATFARSVAINQEDARCVAGMSLLRQAYLRIVPGLEPFFVTGHQTAHDRAPLGHGSRQRFAQVASSLTTTSAVVGALDSMLFGALASDAGALCGARPAAFVAIGAGASIVSAALHTGYAARFRRHHAAVRRDNQSAIAVKRVNP